MATRITIRSMNVELDGVRNWATAKDLFPRIEVDQETAHVSVTYYSVSNSKRGQWGQTHEYTHDISTDGNVLRISGMCGLRNDRRNTGGRQKFCYFVFRGDSGHLYTHRTVASKVWLNCDPADVYKRLRKLGIGADRDVVQQGDFLLKPANGNAYNDDQFTHETTGAGHHQFEQPVLYATGHRGRQYKITEPTLLIHHAVDGIQHPTITVPAGIYCTGTTSNGLRHDNKRD